MNDFIVAIAPAVFFWSLPLVPMVYAAVSATVDTVAKRASTSVPRPRGQGAPRTRPHWQT